MNSSEEFARQAYHKSVFAAAQKKEKQDTEAAKVIRVLDLHISKHQSTTSVREMAKEHHRTADYQLDLSADIVEVLSKIKKELR